MIVGLLLTHGEFRSHHGPGARQYQCLTPGEVQRVGGAHRAQALPDFAFWSRGAGRPEREKIENLSGTQTPEKKLFVVSLQRRAKARAREDTGRPAGQHGRAKANNDS